MGAGPGSDLRGFLGKVPFNATGFYWAYWVTVAKPAIVAHSVLGGRNCRLNFSMIFWQLKPPDLERSFWRGEKHKEVGKKPL